MVEDTVVVVPETVRFPAIVTLSGNPIVIVPELSETSTSLFVPEKVIVPPNDVAVEFEPSVASIQRFKLQAAAHTEETVFTVKTENGNLVFYYGDANTHAGSFIFQGSVSKELQNAWSWPIQQVMSILNLELRTQNSEFNKTQQPLFL